MSGLVIAVMEKIGLNPRFVESVPDVPPRPATLEEELAARGISAIPLKEVRVYQERYMRDQKVRGLAGDLAEWMSHSPGEYRRGIGVIPAEVSQTIRRAETISDSRVVVEHFYADPFVFVVRRKNGLREEVCIGYWDAPGFKVK